MVVYLYSSMAVTCWSRLEVIPPRSREEYLPKNFYTSDRILVRSGVGRVAKSVHRSIAIELHATTRSLAHYQPISASMVHKHRPTCQDSPNPYDARQLFRERRQRRERRHHREDRDRHLVESNFSSAVQRTQVAFLKASTTSQTQVPINAFFLCCMLRCLRWRNTRKSMSRNH